MVYHNTQMKNLGSSLDNWLPHWFEEPQIQWAQWLYALWQIIRCNPLTLLILSFLPFYLRQMYKKKVVVVLGESKDYDMSADEMRDYLSNHPLKNLDIIKSMQLWYKVKHHGYYYITHQNTLMELARCSQLFGDNIIFVEKLMAISGSLSVGKMLSQTEAYERILSKRYHCSKGSEYVVPTWLDYVDLNNKFWLVFSTLPLLLQARNYQRTSNLLSRLIILLDFNRRWLYKVYDRHFDSFSKFVKLRIFKERSALYNYFSIFSSRWRYCDTVKKHAYVAKPGEQMKLRCYSKLISADDIEIVGWHIYDHDPNDQYICMEIVKDRAHCSLLSYGEVYAVAKLHKPIYVSDYNLNSHFMNTQN